MESEIKINKYKVDDFEHHVPESIYKEFENKVRKESKKYDQLGDYKVSSEEHEESCNKPVVDNKIFHSSSGVNVEAIEEVNIQKYEISQSEGDNFIVHCPLDLMEQLANQVKCNEAQSNELDEYSLTIREYRDKCKNSFNNECFIDIDANFQEHDPLASLFAEELKRRNMKQEDLIMNNATSEKQTDKLEFTLEQQLKALNDEQYLTLFSLYGKEGIKEYNELIEDCKNLDEAKLDIVEALAGRIKNDNAEHQPELLELIAKYHFDYLGKDATLDRLKTEIKETRKDLKDIVNGFNKKLNKLVPEDKLLLLKQEKEERKLNKAKLRRQKRIERGLDAHLMAVACAVIEDGQEGGEQYIEKATQQARKVLNKTTKVVEEMDNNDQLPDPKSEKGMKKVFKACLSKKDKSKGFATTKG